MQERLTEYLPQTRCTPTLKKQLEERAARSVSRSLADHIRLALEIYVTLTDAEIMDLLDRFASEQSQPVEPVENGVA